MRFVANAAVTWKVLVAYDGSEESRRALDYSISLFKRGDVVVLAAVLPNAMSPKMSAVALLTNGESDNRRDEFLDWFIKEA
jgi:predicted HTH domain antitoxin